MKLSKKLNQRFFSLNRIPYLVIYTVWLGIVITNFQPRTRFLSWDLMDSSFAPAQMIARSVFGAWQEFQGLGLLGGHGYIAQLPQALISLFLSFILPQQYVRYAFAFLMLLIGSLGSFQLIQSLLFKQGKLNSQLSALISALVYMVYFGTVQTFYVFLEPFIVMYALLPWALFTLLQILGSKEVYPKNYLLFFFINFFLSTIGFIPPIFISYVLSVSLILLTSLLIQLSWKEFKKILILIFIIAATNIYWLYPVVHFTLFADQNYLNAHLNQLTTQEYILKNATYGEIQNVALMKSFYFESLDQNRSEVTQPTQLILQSWMNHFSQAFPKAIAISLFVTGVIGLSLLCLDLFKYKRIEYSLGLVGLIDLSLLATGTPILGWLSIPFRFIPFLNQAFRIPFSKVSMSVSLFLAIGVGIVFWHLLIAIKKYLSRVSTYVNLTLFGLMLVSLLIYAFPIFQGNFLYKGGRVKYPQVYSHLQQFLATQNESARIVPLPIATFTGWDMHHWSETHGYTGSGFLWYGIKQPILHRSFDVWSPYNETFFNQLSTAVYDQNPNTFAQTLDKYDVSYALIDESIFLPDKDDSLLYRDQIKSLLDTIGAQEVWSEEFLSVYQLPATSSDSFIKIPTEFTPVIADTTKTRIDTVYATVGNYLETENQSELSPKTQYPFSELTTESVTDVTYQSNQVILTRPIVVNENQTLAIPGLSANATVTFPSQIRYQNNIVSLHFPQQTTITIGELTVNLPKLADITIPELALSNQIMIQIGDTQFEISQGQELYKNLLLTAGQPLQIYLFNKADVNEAADGKTVDQTKVTSFNLDASMWNQLVSEQQVKVTAPATEVQVSIQNALPIVLTAPSPAQNCNQEKLGSVKKEIVDNALLYVADDNAINCDSYTNFEMIQSQAYLVRWQGENIERRSIKFYIQNLFNNRPDLEVLLPVGPFDQTYLILPWNTQNQAGYSFHWDTRSFGQSAENKLSNVEIYPLNLDQILNLQLQSEIPSPITNTLSLNQIWKFGTHQYGFTVINPTSQHQIFYLSQGFDPAWLALSITQGKLTFLPHYKFNGWANAWTVPAGTYQVYILYWPQLLVFAGFGILIVTFIGLTVLVIKQKQPHTQKSHLNAHLRQKLLSK